MSSNNAVLKRRVHELFKFRGLALQSAAMGYLADTLKTGMDARNGALLDLTRRPPDATAPRLATTAATPTSASSLLLQKRPRTRS